MSQLVTTPTSVSGGSAWSSGSGVYGTRYLNSTGSDESWLSFSFGIDLDSSANVVGAQVTLYADDAGSAQPDGYVQSIDTTITTNLGSVTGTQIRNEVITGGFAAAPGFLTFGGGTDLWGSTLNPSFFNGSNFVVAVRRGTQSNEYTASPRAVQVVTLTIFYTLPGGSMSTRNTVSQKSFIGKEVTPGTLASSFTRLVGLNVQPQPKTTVKTYRSMGQKLPVGTGLMNEAAELPVNGAPNFNELGFIFASLMSADSDVGLITGSSSAYRHTFRSNSRATDTVSNYSIIYGDAVRCHSVAYGQFADFKLDTTGSDITVSGQGMGRPIQDSATLPTPANEVQTVTFGGTISGGSFGLRFMGQDALGIAWSATAATLASNIQTALNALPGIGSGGVVVSGTGPFTVTFSGTAVAGQKLQLLELSPGSNGNNLTGTSPTITIAMTTPGGWTELPFVPIEPDQLNVYMSSTYATLTSSQMLNVFVTDVHFANKAKQFFVLNRSNSGGAQGFAEDSSFEVTFKITAQADTQAMALLSGLRNGTLFYVRLEYISSILIDGTNPYRLCIDLAMNVQNFEPFEDEEGVYAASYTLTTTFDSSQGYSQLVTLDSIVPAY